MGFLKDLLLYLSLWHGTRYNRELSAIKSSTICEFYEKPTTERKRKAAAAVKRHQKKVSKESSRRVRMY